MGVGGTGGVGGAGPSSAVGGLVGMGVDPGLAAAAVAAANSGPAGPGPSGQSAGHPGMVGNAAGDHGPAAPSAPSAPSGGYAGGHPGMVGNGPGSGVQGHGGFGSGGGMDGGGFGGYGGYAGGTAFGSSKGDYGGPSIGGSSGRNSGFGSIGLALAEALAGRVNDMANRPGSTHGKNSASSRGFTPARSEHAMNAPSPVGVKGSRPGPKGDLGTRGMTGAMPSVGDRSRGHATAQDPGPRGMPAPGLPDFSDPHPTPSPVGPRHSTPTPSPVSGNPTTAPGRRMSDDVLDTVFDGLRRANDFARSYNQRAAYHDRRYGGVGGGGIDDGLLGHLQRRNEPSGR